jgi:hypothetical protein
MNDGRHDVRISTVPRSSLVWSFPLGKFESWTRICSNCGLGVRRQLTSHGLQAGWDTDKHLPVVNGIGVLEGIEESSEGRVLHVEWETGVAILELLDSTVVVFLKGRVRTRRRRVLWLDRIPFGTWRRT